MSEVEKVKAPYMPGIRRLEKRKKWRDSLPKNVPNNDPLKSPPKKNRNPS